MRRGRGEVSRQNARADRRCEGSSSACSRSEERPGEGWRVLAIGGADATRPKEGGARCLERQIRVESERRGRVEKALVESRVESE